MRKISSFLIGAFLGGMTGAALALLLAPESGDHLRAELQQRSQVLLDEIKLAADQRRQELRAQLETWQKPPVG